MVHYCNPKKLALAYLTVLVIAPCGLSGTWDRCPAPEGGYLNCIASCGPYLFVGTRGNGVLRWSEPDGRWEERSNGIGKVAVYRMVSVDNVLFAGTLGNGLYVERWIMERLGNACGWTVSRET